MAVLEGQDWLAVAGVGVLLFGGAWLPGFIRSLGRARAASQDDPGADPAAGTDGSHGGETEVRPSLDRVEPTAPLAPDGITLAPDGITLAPDGITLAPDDVALAADGIVAGSDAVVAGPDPAPSGTLAPDGLAPPGRTPVTVSGRVAIPIGDVRAERAELEPVPEAHLPAFEDVATPDGLLDPVEEERARSDPHAVLWRRIDEAAGSARRGPLPRRR